MWPFRRTRALTIDPAEYDSEAVRLRQSLIDRDWRAARDLLRGVTDPDDRAFYLGICAEVPGVQDWIGQWVAAEPESTLPLLVRGCHGISWAWQARGSGRAKDVGKDAFRVFFRRLKLAEDCLDEVVARDPEDVTAWAYLVLSARGRQLDRAAADRRFAEVVRRHPNHLVAHEQMLQYRCGKWYGSHDEMFEFARTATAAAPDGSLLPEIVAVAHLEMWLALPVGEDQAHLERPEVRAELIAAAERSIWHPGYRPRPGWPSRFNTFAMAFSLAGEQAAAAAVFDAIGDRVTEWPWCYRAGSEVRVFQRARRDAYQKRGAPAAS